MANFASSLVKLGRNDARLIWRDAFLFGMVFYMLLFAVVLRFGLPALAEYLAQNPETPFDLSPFYPPLIAYVVTYASSMVAGMIIGFVMIDEGDQHTLVALLVTPMPLMHFILYRIFVPVGLGATIALLSFYVINLALLPLWQMVLISIGTGLTGALMMLVLSVFSDNKVQGFALIKGVGMGGMLILGSWFVEMPLHYLFGLFPPYWVAKAYWLALANDPTWFLHLVIGWVYISLCIGVFVRLYRNKAQRAVLA